MRDYRWTRIYVVLVLSAIFVMQLVEVLRHG